MKYVAPEDIIVYSIDEVFMDVTDYLGMHGLSPHGLAKKIIQEVLEMTGITATARDRHQSLSRKDRDGYHGEAYSC